MRYPNEFGPPPPAPPPPPPPPPPSAFMVFINIINTMTHLVLGGVVTCAFCFAIVWGNFSSFPINNNKHLANHVYLCVLGYVLMMAAGVLSFSSHAGWAVSLRYEDKRIVHLAMQVVGSLLALVGSFMRISDMNSHFQSAHAIMGLMAMIMTVISLVGGVLNLFLKATLFTKVVHSCAGSLTILFAFICLCFGFDRPVYRFVMGEDIAHLAIALTVIGLVGVLLSAFISNVKKIINR